MNIIRRNKGQVTIQHVTVILVIIALAGSWMAYSAAADVDVSEAGGGGGFPSTIKIGALASAPVDIDKQHGAFELALKDLNNLADKMGIDTKFVMREEQAEASATKAKERASSLLAWGADVIIGQIWSGHAMALRTMANTREELIISTCTTTTKLVGSPEMENDWIFRASASDLWTKKAIVSMIKGMGIKAIVMPYVNKGYPSSLMEALSNEVEVQGIEPGIVEKIPLSPGKNDYTPAYSDVADAYSSAVDKYGVKHVAVYNSSTASRSHYLMSSAAHYDVLMDKAVMFSTDAAGEPVLTDDIPKIADKMDVIGHGYLLPTGSELYKNFKERHKKLTGSKPTFWSYICYDAMKVLGHSFLMAGTTDPHVIKEVYPEICETYHGVSGSMRMDKYQDRVNAAFRFETIVTEDGEVTWHRIAEYVGGDLTYMGFEEDWKDSPTIE